MLNGAAEHAEVMAKVAALVPAEMAAIDRVWHLLDPDALIQRPPPRRWLLRHPSRDGVPTMGGDGDGLLPRGKAGLLVADGGVGKTRALIGLGLSTITGRRWLGHFHVEDEARRGRVLLLLAEEDEDEVKRRLYEGAEAYGLDKDERRHVAARLIALPLAGTHPALVTVGPDGHTEVDSPELLALRRRLDEFADVNGWSLVVLDPFSRIAGRDAEVDNNSATRSIQALESLTKAPGGPTVIVAHHASLAAVQTGSLRGRGVTGIRDGVKWEATLRADGKDVLFKQTKSNYSRPMFEELRLVRDEGGELRVPTADEQTAHDAAVEERQGEREAERARERDARYAARVAEMMEKVVAVATEEPQSGRELAAALKARPGDVQPAILAAVKAGRLKAGAPSRGCDRFFLPPPPPPKANGKGGQ